MFINRYLIAFARGHGAQIASASLLQLLLTVFGTLISLGVAFLVRMIQGEQQILFFSRVWQVFLMIAVLVFSRFVLSKQKAIVSERCSLAIKSSLRDRLLQKLFSLGPAYMGKERTGNIASAISTKVEYLNEYYTIYLPAAVAALINAVILIGALMGFDPVTAGTCIIGCIGTLISPMLFYFLMRKRGDMEMRAYSQYYSDCLDSVQGMSTLKAFNANSRQKELIHKKGESLRRAVMGQLRITMLENMVLYFFIGLGGAFSIAVAAYRCVYGHMQSGNLVYALFLIGACFAPMIALINAWHFGYRGVVASYSIIELLEATGKLPLRAPVEKDTKTTADFEGAIRFEHVSFAYDPKDGNVLEDVTFTIPHGTTTALVGPSGSGKTTIAHLLAGFYPVEKGAIFVGKKCLDRESVGEIQDGIAAVWQDCRLFYGTVRENILMGKPSATEEEIIHAAKEANIHELIASLPEGYETMIGESGMRLSGGERQRVALARAFLRNAPFVILDEATSSLDRRNEMAVQQSLQKLSSGKTCLVIAHRLATIQAADQIILMENGRIKAQGTHDHLFKSSDHYRRLMGNQAEGGCVSAT